MANSKIQLQNLSMAANQHPDACKKMKSTMVFTSKEDRISKLPDDILTNILSFLPTESSVATSVLAKRWNHVWSLVPNLDFSTKHRVCRVKRIRFAEFVDRVLLINKVSYVRKVCLHCIEDWDTARAIDCINATVTREATEIFDLQLPITFCNDVNTSHMNLVPTSFFHQKSLVTLKLGSIVLNVPSFVCFPSLENIVLQLVSFVDDDEGNALKNLLSGCPNLKSLFLRGGFLKDEKNIYICSTSLLDLKIDIGTDDEYLGYKAVIDAPNLRSIDLTDDAGTTFDIINASALVKATLCIRQHDEEPSHVCDKRLQALLLNISQVKELFLRTSTIKFLDDVESPVGFLPLFNNVAYLEVDMTGGSWWPVVPRLLHSMPNLVDFVIYLSHADESDSDNDLHEPLGLPHCLSTSLKKVKIVYVNDDDDDVEISLIYYLLKHAMSLKKASIHTRRLNLREAAEFIEELQKLRKSSGACEIKYKNMDNYARVISSHHIGT